MMVGTFLKDDLNVLLLKAGLWPPNRALGAWKEFCARIENIEALDNHSYRLFPLVAVNLENFTATLPHRDYLQSVLKHSWAQAQRVLASILSVARTLENENIDFLVFKGIALASIYYGHWGVRPTMNAGLLIHPQDVEMACQALLRAGCLPSVETRLGKGKDLVRFRHEMVWSHPDGIEFSVCWHLIQAGGKDQAENNPWDAAGPCPFPGLQTKTLGATDHFLQICLDRTDFSHANTVVQLIDAAIVLREGKPDWALLEKRARALQHTDRIREVILNLDRFDLGVPATTVSLWRHIEAGPLEKIERALHARPGIPRSRIKDLALVYLRLNLDATQVLIWRNLGAYLKQLHDLKGILRRILLIWYIIRWNRLRTTSNA